ncbi:MAG: hypothetical protein ACK4I0_03035 [Brevundimonas sp.]|uniref:hypothetical protein n=1 Tax=Brevundimonas sp. TaxID=1871086 RepID=UPI00391DCF63
MPPHDLEGKINPHFLLINAGDLNHYKWSFNKTISGTFIGSDSLDLLSNLSNDLSWCAFSNSLTGSSRNQEVIIANALMRGSVNLSIAAHGSKINLSRTLILGSVNLALPNASHLDASLSCIDGNFTASGDSLSTVAINARVGGDFSIQGTVNASRIKVNNFTARQSTTRRIVSSSIIIDNARIHDLDIGGSYDEVSARNIASRDINISCAGAKKVDAFGAIAKSFLISNDVEQINIDNVRVMNLRLSRIRSTEIAARKAIISGLFHAQELDVKSFYLDQSSVEDSCLFERSQFHEQLSANGSVFRAEASFSRCGFPGALRFRSSVFQKGANFRTGSGADVSSDVKYSQVGEADFHGALFFPNQNEVCADFDARQFLEAANFETAKFEGVAKFFGCQFHEDTSFRGAEFKIVPPASSYSQALRNLPWQNIILEWKTHTAPFVHLHEIARRFLRDLKAPLAARRGDHNRRLSNYERSYNALRQRFEKIGNSKEERRFHTYELRARRQRIDANATLLEGILSGAYDLFSLYGQSISRPLIILVLFVWLGFSALYYAMAWDFGLNQAVESLVFSARQIIRPFSAWGREFLIPASYSDQSYNTLLSEWTGNLIGIGSDATLIKTTIVRILASIQSVCGLILLFLTGLAVKRTFGVS